MHFFAIDDALLWILDEDWKYSSVIQLASVPIVTVLLSHVTVLSNIIYFIYFLKSKRIF